MSPTPGVPWRLLAASALAQAVVFLLRPAASYEALALGAPVSSLGVLSAAFAVAPLVLALPLGRAVDRFGEKRTMIVGTSGIVVTTVLFLVGPDRFSTVVWSTALLGAAHLGCIVGQQAMMANGYASARLDAMFGYYTFAASLGQALGPLVIAVLGGGSATPPTRPIFLVSLALTVLLLAVTLAVPGGRAGREPGPAPRGAGGIGGLLRTPGVPQALATSAMVLAAVELTVVYLPALGAERGLSASAVGVLLTVRALASMASRLLLSQLIDLMGRNRLLVVSLLVSAAAFMATPVPMPALVLTAVVAALGLGLGVGQPVTMAWLGRAAPEGQRGQAMSVRLGANRLGQFLIPPLLGTVAAGLGAGGVLWALAAGLGATTLLLRPASRRRG
ncbi:MFS transporter [Nocardiopsis salina]|uniref:MFS transporter n=1 Tax=Nocardiopsis salina TaxID=245836 RepID=UPI0004771AEF|nr:MFS transporter [Nocardiopsis salina]